MIKACGYRILIEVDDIGEMDDVYKRARAANIELPEHETERLKTSVQTGKVVDIGPLAFKAWEPYQPWCEVGDVIYFKRYEGILEKVEDKSYRIINDDDIYGVKSRKSED